MKVLPIPVALAVAIGAGIIFAENKAMTEQPTSAGARLPVEGQFPSLAGATGWLNSKPLTTADLGGKVVLVDFWTYSCVNWLRTEPYVRAWADKYMEHGLVIIGVHTPEFGFEKNVDNIRWAAKNYDVRYPIAIDSDYAVWRAFDNHYWPAIYLIDAEGRIRYRQFGEGDYDRTERAIQELLVEAGMSGFDRAPVSADGKGVEAAADWDSVRSPETYAGSARGENFSSPGGIIPGGSGDYEIPERLRLNQWAVSGSWNIGSEAAIVKASNGRLAFRFHARDLNLVMGSAPPGSTVRFRVRIDGQPPGADGGLDVAREGSGSIAQQRLYQMIRQKHPIVDRTFEIEFLDPGAELFVFTFG
jgi:thiol-disulfide isomerase/thioredoxin